MVYCTGYMTQYPNSIPSLIGTVAFHTACDGNWASQKNSRNVHPPSPSLPILTQPNAADVGRPDSLTNQLASVA